VLRERSAAEWLQRLEAAGVPCAPVLTRNEVIEHPQVHANALVVETDHPDAGRLRQSRPAARFSASPTEPIRPAPALGADGAAVLAEAGYTREDIAALEAAGVLARAGQ